MNSKNETMKRSKDDLITLLPLKRADLLQVPVSQEILWYWFHYSLLSASRQGQSFIPPIWTSFLRKHSLVMAANVNTLSDSNFFSLACPCSEEYQDSPHVLNDCPCFNDLRRVYGVIPETPALLTNSWSFLK